MRTWYYALDGKQAGPVEENELKTKFVKGQIRPDTWVWTSEFGQIWKKFSETDLILGHKLLDSDGPPSPPPSAADSLETQQSVAAPSSRLSEDIASDNTARDFIQSPLVEALVGKKQNYYRSKWSIILKNNNGNPADAFKSVSWNWAAFLFPSGWAIYRKMYALGAFVLALQIIYILLPEDSMKSFVRAMNMGIFGASLVIGLYGNGLYLDKIFKDWVNLGGNRSPKIPEVRAKIGSPVHKYAPAAIFAGLLAIAAVQEFGVGNFQAFSAGPTCSSSDTINLVQKIAKEHIAKDLTVLVSFDVEKSKVNLRSIRTQSSNSSYSECAANIEYSLHAKVSGVTPEFSSWVEKALRKDITYKTERTDKGDEIYVTVWGL